MDLNHIYTNFKYLKTPEFYQLTRTKLNSNRDLIRLISNESQSSKRCDIYAATKDRDIFSRHQPESTSNSVREQVTLPKINSLYLNKKKIMPSILNELKDVPADTARCEEIKLNYKKQLQAVLKDTANKLEQIEQLQASKRIYSQYSQSNVSNSLLTKKTNQSKHFICNKQYNSKSLEQFQMNKPKLLKRVRNFIEKWDLESEIYSFKK